jgi:Na+/proline symporter
MISEVLLAVFLVAMGAVGCWGMKRASNLVDFSLGGQDIGSWFSAFAYGTAYFFAVRSSRARASWWGFGLNALWIGLTSSMIEAYLAGHVFGHRMGIMSQNRNAMTLPKFLHEHYQIKHIKVLRTAVI